jgi:large conductance mechanosensitive channel
MPSTRRPFREEEKMFKGFRDFILRGNVVDLAVAVIIGAAFTQIVNSLVKDMLTALTFEINGSQFRYGNFINTVIAFLITAFVIYFLIVVPANKLLERRRKGQEPPPEPTEDILLLRQIRDLLGGSEATPTGDTPRPPSPGPRS